MAIVQRGKDLWRGLNLVPRASPGRFSDAELQVLVGFAAIVLPMLPFNRANKAATRLRRCQADQFEARVCEALSGPAEREREVCARAALGMSVEATALDLGIGKTSVLTYRQRAYRRLEVGSPVELMALVAR